VCRCSFFTREEVAVETTSTAIASCSYSHLRLMPGHSPPITAKSVPTYFSASADIYSSSLAYYPILHRTGQLGRESRTASIDPSSSVLFSYTPGDISIHGTRLAYYHPKSRSTGSLVTKSVVYDGAAYHKYEESLAVTTITRHL
jgi:hypothetical protein